MYTNLEKLYKMKCIEKGITVSQMSKDANVANQSVYSKVFKGNPTLATLDKLAEALNCDIEIRLIERF